MKLNLVGGPARTERKPYSLANRNGCGENRAFDALGESDLFPTPPNPDSYAPSSLDQGDSAPHLEDDDD